MHLTNEGMWQRDEARRRKDREARAEEAAGFPSYAKVVIEGVIVDKCPLRLGERWAARMVQIFFDHLKQATQDPGNFEFDGAGGRRQASDWLAWQADRIGPIRGEVSLLIGHRRLDSFAVGEAEPVKMGTFATLDEAVTAAEEMDNHYGDCT